MTQAKVSDFSLVGPAFSMVLVGYGPANHNAAKFACPLHDFHIRFEKR